ncbi:conserved hypothetical protein [Listeria monocytogenes str. 4b H7858]|nr:conserved hypothetical protein [Listeria monocytogenes str. 4b H7858] [Listeria monocytogenes serotype 4b str. H7858]
MDKRTQELGEIKKKWSEKMTLYTRLKIKLDI